MLETRPREEAHVYLRRGLKAVEVFQTNKLVQSIWDVKRNSPR